MIGLQIVNKNIGSALQISVTVNACLNTADNTVHQYVGLQGSDVSQNKCKQFGRVAKRDTLLETVMSDVIQNICTGWLDTLVII